MNDEYSNEKHFRDRHHFGTCNCTCRQLSFLTASSWLVELQRNSSRCVDSDRAIPAVPNPDNASTDVVISAEILPTDFKDTAGESIKTNKVRDRSLSTASAHSVRLLTTSAAKDGGSWVWFAGLKQQINITTAKAGACWFIGSPDRAPAVPNPKNASFAAIVSTEILPMILNETAGKIIKNGVHVVRHHQMFCSNPFFYTRHEVHVRRILLILSC